MFVCESCHNKSLERLNIKRDSLFGSYGKCEICDTVADCVDCHCTSIEIEEYFASLKREGKI